MPRNPSAALPPNRTDPDGSHPQLRNSAGAGRRAGLLALTVALAALACTSGQGPAAPTAAEGPAAPTAAEKDDQPSESAETTILFQDGAYQIPIPDWPELEISDRLTLRAVQNRQGWSMSVVRQPATPRLLAGYLHSVLPNYGEYSSLKLNERPIDAPSIEGLTSDDDPVAFRYDYRYCDGATYQLSASGPQSSFAEFRSLYDRLLDESRCTAPAPPNPNEPGIVGLVINASNNDLDFEDFRASVLAARQGGVRASHTYFTWGDIETAPGEYDWRVPDLLVDVLVLEGIRMSVVIDFIHTSVPGKVPADLEGLAFDDPRYIERASAFSVAVAEHFGDSLDYLMLGNEINIYLAQHPEQVAPFLSAYQAMRQAVHAAQPELPVGTVLAFHELMSAGDYGLIQQFSVGDFLAYTYYPHAPGFRYDGPTDGFGAVLDAMIDQSGDTPFIVVENGWATSELLGSSEASQAEYIRNSFEAIAERRGSIERLIWYGFHDGERELCERGGLSFFEEGFDPGSLGESWEPFVEYLCTLGLRNFDGSPKLGWQTFQEQLEAYEAGR